MKTPGKTKLLSIMNPEGRKSCWRRWFESTLKSLWDKSLGGGRNEFAISPDADSADALKKPGPRSARRNAAKDAKKSRDVEEAFEREGF